MLVLIQLFSQVYAIIKFHIILINLIDFWEKKNSIYKLFSLESMNQKIMRMLLYLIYVLKKKRIFYKFSLDMFEILFLLVLYSRIVHMASIVLSNDFSSQTFTSISGLSIIYIYRLESNRGTKPNIIMLNWTELS